LNFINDNAPTSITNFIGQETYTITNLGTNSNWNAVGAGTTLYVGQTFRSSGPGVGNGTARNNNQVITGYNSGATAIVTAVNNEEISYFQPQIYADNSIRTSTELTLYQGTTIDKTIPANGNVYLINNFRVINSKSNIVNGSATDDFIIRVGMTNNGFKSASPIVDADLSILNVYQYQITSSESTTSKWITKEVTLQDQFDADGMKVYLTAYHPAGTFVDVYARFTYPTNIEVQSNWIQLVNKNPDMYSNSVNTSDYRQFE
jgi:hypothetical protein